MSRSIILSNGQLAIALDAHALVRDVYYPHVGLENHARLHYLHRVGVFVDGSLSWLSDGKWHVTVECEAEALISNVSAKNDELGIELRFSDFVAMEKNIFLRRVIVKNARDYAREIKLYFSHEFEIHKMHGSDTAYFDPSMHAIIHYKGQRVFLINGLLGDESFSDFATGRAHALGREGSHRDAEDGELSKNPIEHGPADSIIGFYASYGKHEERVCDYWMIAAKSIPEAKAINAYVRTKSPRALLSHTATEWHRWMRGRKRDFHDLADEHVALFKKSLMLARAHADHDGGIIASLDSDMFQYGLDTYSYVWPRDAAFIALAFDAVGDPSIAKRFFEFCADVITAEGYFMHKYQPDKSLGSSWHPWIVNGRLQLPIQEDETAIVIYALHEHIKESKDMDLLERVYEPLVERAADFLVSYRNPDTKLPLPSYDLWERKRGTSTYTSAAVFGALQAAAALSKMLKEDKKAASYEKAAREIRQAILTDLWRNDACLFYNMLDTASGLPDATVDISSVYGIFLFNVLPPSEMRLRRAFETSVRRLSEGVAAGGIARFENDDYYRVPGPSTGNPWFLTTLWYAEYLTEIASNRDDLRRVRDIFSWVAKYALPSGVLSEQLDPHTGAQVCAGPLAWAHSTYVRAILKYLERYEQLSK